MHGRGGAVARDALVLSRERTAYQHEVVVGRPSVVRADELAMDSEQVALNTAVKSGWSIAFTRTWRIEGLLPLTPMAVTGSTL